MEEKLGKRLKRRALSLLLATTLVVSTPATDSGMLQGIFSGVIKKAQAAQGAISDTKSLDEVIADTYLRSQLKELVGNNQATVSDLRNLTEIKVDSRVTDLTGLGYARSLQNVDLSACAANNIEKYEFAECSYLKKVVMASTITELGDYAFSNCKSLSEIDISNVTKIGSFAFGGCTALTDDSFHTMKENLAELGEGAFSGCTSLQKVYVPVISSGGNAHAVPSQMFNGCTGVTEVTFCDTQVNRIAAQAFSDTGKLVFNYGASQGVNRLPDSVANINQGAFSGSKIVSLDLSNLTGLTEIAASTFNKCWIQEITFPSSLTKIGESAFQEARLKEVVLPNSVTTMESSAFKGTGNLLKVTLSINLKEIPEYAFQWAGSYDFSSGGTSLVFDENFDLGEYGMHVTFNGDPANSKLETIGGSAFNASTMSDKDFLTNLKNLKTIKESAFYYTDFTKVTIPACVETIEEKAFSGMYWLTELEFAPGSNVTELPKDFCGADKDATDRMTYADLVLKKVVLPDNLKVIGEECFRYCRSLYTVGYQGNVVEGEFHFPNSLKEIQTRAFENCSVNEIKFYDEDTNTYYNNTYCIPLKRDVINNSDMIKKVVLPDSVDTLGEGVFASTLMSRIEVGKGIKELPKSFCEGAGVFPYKEKTSSLMKAEDAVARPSDDPDAEEIYTPIAFAGLTSVGLPDTLEVIGESAFKNCYALRGFDSNSTSPADYLPDSLVKIEKEAFRSCKDIGSLKFPSKLEEIGESAFEDASVWVNKTAISQTAGSMDSKEVSYPKQYGTPYDFNFSYANNLKTIGNAAFRRTNISSIAFQSHALTKIPDSVCEGCYNLTSVSIPETVTEIGANAFKDNYKLTNLVAPLSAKWSKSLFSGMTARDKGTVTVNAVPARRTDNVYIGKTSALSFQCVNDFEDVIMTVKDLDATDNSKSTLTDAGNQDANQYVTISSEEANTINLTGKTSGQANLEVAASINLAGDPRLEHNSARLSEVNLTLQLTQMFNINVTNNPIGILEFDSNQLIEEAGYPVLYLGYGSTTPAKVDVTYEGADKMSSTTDTVNWSISNENVAKIANTPTPTETVNAEGAYSGKFTVEILPEESLDNTELKVNTSSGLEKICKIKIRVPVSTLDLKETTATRDIGKTFALTLNQGYSNDNRALLETDEYQGMEDVIVYSSDNPSVATVDQSGNVTTVGEGTATITVRSLASGKSDTCKVTVESGAPDPSMDEVSISPSPVELFLGDEPTQLKAVPFPADAVLGTVTWTIDNPEIASVTADGKVTGLKVGTATIKATTENEKTATCSVKVQQHVETFSLQDNEKTVYIDKTVSLSTGMVVLPDDAYVKRPTWTSTDETIASVDENGNVKGIRIGEATITATLDDKVAVCRVLVKIEPESVSLNEETLSLFIGDQPTALTATVLPGDADQVVKWTSGNEEVATVSEDGRVTPIKAGTADIKVTTGNDKTASCRVTVKTHLDSVTLKKTELSLVVGKSETLSADVLPENATDKSVTWSSSDESVAKVDARTGKVEGIKIGKAVITATTADGKKATCNVSVGAEPATVNLSLTEGTLQVGKQLTLTASVTPAEANQVIEWKSSNETVATVENGVVTALQAGTCDITATAAGSSVNAVCKLIVTPAPPKKVKLKKAKNLKKKSIKVTWKKVKDAEGYQVVCGSKKKETTSTSAKFKKLKIKKKYVVRVRAYITYAGTKVYGKWSAKKKVKVKK